MRHIFLEKLFTKFGRETIPRPFSKTSLVISLDQYPKILCSLFVLYQVVCQVESYQNILKLNCRPLTFTSYKAFLKNKKRSETSALGSTSA